MWKRKINAFRKVNPQFNVFSDDEIKQLLEDVEKANTQTECECCGKKVFKGKITNLKLPIVIYAGENGEKKHFEAKDMEICESCCNVLLNAYYTEANKHNRTGWCGVAYD